MAVIFYPHDEDINVGSIKERLQVLFDAAERYKAAILDVGSTGHSDETRKQMTPREIKVAFNWEEIAKIFREIRELPESSPSSKTTKGDHLTKLAEIYEVLRSAKMPKLEAVRIALLNEARHLRNNTK
jgi:hypothetical protein